MDNVWVNLRKVWHETEKIIPTDYKVVYVSLVSDKTDEHGLKEYVAFIVPSFEDAALNATYDNVTYYLYDNVTVKTISVFTLYQNVTGNSKNSVMDYITPAFWSDYYITINNSLESFHQMMSAKVPEYGVYDWNKETLNAFLADVFRASIDNWLKK